MDAFRMMLDQALESIIIPESLRQRRVAVLFIALDQAGQSTGAGVVGRAGANVGARPGGGRAEFKA